MTYNAQLTHATKMAQEGPGARTCARARARVFVCLFIYIYICVCVCVCVRVCACDNAPVCHHLAFAGLPHEAPLPHDWCIHACSHITHSCNERPLRHTYRPCNHTSHRVLCLTAYVVRMQHEQPAARGATHAVLWSADPLARMQHTKRSSRECGQPYN